MLWLLRFYGSKLLSLFEKPINSSKTRVLTTCLCCRLIEWKNEYKRFTWTSRNEKNFNFINKQQTGLCQHIWQFINPQGFVIVWHKHHTYVCLHSTTFFFFFSPTHSFTTLSHTECRSFHPWWLWISSQQIATLSLRLLVYCGQEQTHDWEETTLGYFFF